MVSQARDKDSIRSSSPTVVQLQHKRTALLTGCCGCYRTRPAASVDDDKSQHGFFRRMQFFKAQKRRSCVRRPPLSATVSNGHHVVEPEKSATATTELPTPSLPSLSRPRPRRAFNHSIDSYSFADIEIGSSTNDDKSALNRSATPKSIPWRKRSSLTTNLSAYSSQTLLRKLLDKAQVLDEYYQDISTKIADRPNAPSSTSLSSSSSSLREQSGATPRLFLYRNRSNDSVRRAPRRSYRQVYGNVSSDSSRFDLYDDEDNILRELVRFNNDIDLILSRLEMEGECLPQPANNNNDDEPSVDAVSRIHAEEELERTDSNEILTMRTNTSELNIHLLLSTDIDRLRELALSKLLKLVEAKCSPEHVHSYESITLAKLNKLPKSTTWKGKRVFGVPLRVYQQNTGHILPPAIANALQYIRLHAGKCDGLFRKPGVKSKIDRLRSQIETANESSEESSAEAIKFDDYQPYVVADTIRQYFRELPECLIPLSITRLLCDLLKHLSQEEQLLAMRYTFLLLPDETREVLETMLRFLLDISVRLGNSQVNCRSLARIFLPSVFQSFYDMHTTSSKILWWRWKKEKSDGILQENDRLLLENALMAMILNIDTLCRVPSALSDELVLPSARKTKRLDELVRGACNGEFHIKKYISKTSEEFLQRLSATKFKNVPTNVDGVSVAVHRPSAEETTTTLPVWKCSVDIPGTNVKQVYQRIVHDRFLWDANVVESRTVEKIDDDKEIVQYVLNYLDLVPVRSFCEFRFSKKITSRSASEANAMLISAVSIDHLQNHFLPGSVGVTYGMHYYITPSATQPGKTTVTQVACADQCGRSTQWYENVYGSVMAHHLLSLRNTFMHANSVAI